MMKFVKEEKENSEYVDLKRNKYCFKILIIENICVDLDLKISQRCNTDQTNYVTFQIWPYGIGILDIDVIP